MRLQAATIPELRKESIECTEQKCDGRAKGY